MAQPRRRHTIRALHAGRCSASTRHGRTNIPPAHHTCNLHHVAPTRAVGTTSHLNTVCHRRSIQHRQSEHPQPLHGAFAAAARTSSHLCAPLSHPQSGLHPTRTAAASASRTGSHRCRCRDTCSLARVPASPPRCCGASIPCAHPSIPPAACSSLLRAPRSV